MEPETEFLTGMLELSYGQDVEKKLKQIAPKVKWARGWPEQREAFWNAEAFMWQHKVEKEKRVLIAAELQSLNGRNLDLGCGAYSYLPSVGFDCAEKMLQFNSQCTEKVIGDLEQKLPFESNSFDSVTAVFLFNYVQNYSLLMSEIKRVLRADGVFVMVLSATGVQDWQRQKEVNDFSAAEWEGILETEFTVQFYSKERLWFFRCEKKS